MSIKTNDYSFIHNSLYFLRLVTVYAVAGRFSCVNDSEFWTTYLKHVNKFGNPSFFIYLCQKDNFQCHAWRCMRQFFVFLSYTFFHTLSVRMGCGFLFYKKAPGDVKIFWGYSSSLDVQKCLYELKKWLIFEVLHNIPFSPF